MASERKQLKKVDAEKMAAGIYAATFLSGATFTADVRSLPIVDADGKPTGETFGDAGWLALPPMVQKTTSYGLKQKLDDSMAGVEDETEAMEELTSTWEAIVKGNWTSRVPGEGVEGGLFARAYSEHHGISLADAKTKIGNLVKANTEANRARITDEKKREEITERMVFNRIRDVALERDTALKAKYDDLKAKKAKRATARQDIEVNL